jgi:hypothetical protein
MTNVDIMSIIGKAPLQIMAMYFDKGGVHPMLTRSYFYNIEIWHERCLHTPDNADDEDEDES